MRTIEESYARWWLAWLARCKRLRRSRRVHVRRPSDLFVTVMFRAWRYQKAASFGSGTPSARTRWCILHHWTAVESKTTWYRQKSCARKSIAINRTTWRILVSLVYQRSSSTRIYTWLRSHSILWSSTENPAAERAVFEVWVCEIYRETRCKNEDDAEATKVGPFCAWLCPMVCRSLQQKHLIQVDESVQKAWSSWWNFPLNWKHRDTSVHVELLKHLCPMGDVSEVQKWKRSSVQAQCLWLTPRKTQNCDICLKTKKSKGFLHWRRAGTVVPQSGRIFVWIWIICGTQSDRQFQGSRIT